MSENYPIPAFHFQVLFKGLEGITDIDQRFESVSGIKATLEIENTIHGLKPEKNIIKTIFDPVILRRGVVDPKGSVLLKWIFKCINNAVYDPLPEVLIQVLDEEHKPTITFSLKKVSLKSWAAGELNAQRSELFIEEITLEYHSIEFIPG